MIIFYIFISHTLKSSNSLESKMCCHLYYGVQLPNCLMAVIFLLPKSELQNCFKELSRCPSVLQPGPISINIPSTVQLPVLSHSQINYCATLRCFVLFNLLGYTYEGMYSLVQLCAERYGTDITQMNQIHTLDLECKS